MNIDRMLKALSSLKLTVTLLFFISALCLVGTVFPQIGDPVSSGQGWTSRILSLLSPYDIFHSLWFMGAGLLLCLNSMLCMRRRLNLKKRSLLMLFLHGGILLVIAGYAVGAMSLDGFVEIPEGGSVSRVELKKGGSRDLGFAVRCDRFTVDYYESGMPKEYVSDLSFTADSHVIDQAQLKVNHPASVEGISFYQESFRQSLSAVVAYSDGQKKAVFTAREGDIIPLPTGTAQARVVNIRDDLMHAGPAVKLLITDLSGTRSLWVFEHIDALKSRMSGLVETVPEFDPSGFPPYTFSCERIDVSYVTGIGVKRDPGTPLVAAGGALFLFSLLFVFLAPPGRLGSHVLASGMQAAPAPAGEGSSDDAREETKAGKPGAAKA